MAIIVTNHLIVSISGKLCKKDTTYLAVNKQTGKMYSAGYHGCVQPNSEKQQATKADFAKKSEIFGFLVATEPPFCFQHSGHRGLPRCYEGV